MYYRSKNIIEKRIKRNFNEVLTEINETICKITSLLERNKPIKRNITQRMKAQVKGDLKRNVRRKP